MLLRENNKFYLEIVTCDPLISIMDHCKFIASNEKEEFISTLAQITAHADEKLCFFVAIHEIWFFSNMPRVTLKAYMHNYLVGVEV